MKIRKRSTVPEVMEGAAPPTKRKQKSGTGKREQTSGTAKPPSMPPEDDGWDNRPWAIGSLCKAFYNFGDGFIYRVTEITYYEPTKNTTLALQPVFSAFSAEGFRAGNKHTKPRTLGSTLCTLLSLHDIQSELIRLESFINEEIAQGTQNDLQPLPHP